MSVMYDRATRLGLCGLCGAALRRRRDPLLGADFWALSCPECGRTVTVRGAAE